MKEVLKIYTGPPPKKEEPFVPPLKSDVQADFQELTKEKVEKQKEKENYLSSE
jgi:hypothetical protein